MTYLQIAAIVIPIAAAILGLWMLLGLRSTVRRKKRRATEFLATLTEYVKDKGEDTERYHWLLRESVSLQREAGSLGIASFKPPHSNYIINNFPIIVNLLPMIHQCLSGTYTKLTGFQLFESLESIVVQHVGALNEELVTVNSELRNPIIWLREGVRQILLVPLLLLEWTGLARPATAERLAGRAAFSIISGVFSILSVVSAIITIVLGWSGMAEYLKQFLR